MMNKPVLLTGMTLIASVLLLSGCMAPPDGALKSVKTADEAGYTKTFQEISAIDLLGDHWWTRYQDQQLNQLIESALADSPAMAQAQARLKTIRVLHGRPAH